MDGGYTKLCQFSAGGCVLVEADRLSLLMPRRRYPCTSLVLHDKLCIAGFSTGHVRVYDVAQQKLTVSQREARCRALA